MAIVSEPDCVANNNVSTFPMVLDGRLNEFMREPTALGAFVRELLDNLTSFDVEEAAVLKSGTRANITRAMKRMVSKNKLRWKSDSLR